MGQMHRMCAAYVVHGKAPSKNLRDVPAMANGCIHTTSVVGFGWIRSDTAVNIMTCTQIGVTMQHCMRSTVLTLPTFVARALLLFKSTSASRKSQALGGTTSISVMACGWIQMVTAAKSTTKTQSGANMQTLGP